MSINRIRDRHHGLAKDLAAGYPLKSCYLKWGFDKSTAKYLVNHHTFKELIGHYQKQNRSKDNESQGLPAELPKQG